MITDPLRDPHEAWSELAVGYALYALEPEEEQAFRQHLAGCARCAQDLREHEHVLSHLAYATPASEPPGEIGERIRSGLLASGRGASFAEPAAQEQPDAGGVTSLKDARSARARRRLSVAPLAAAAAAVLVLAAGAFSLGQRSTDDTRSGVLAAAVSELGADGTRSVPLRSDDGQLAGVALVRGSELSVLVDGLPENPSDTTYVVWGRFGVEVRPVGTFDVTGSDVQLAQNLRLSAPPEQLSALMVTREQGRVAPAAPRSPVVASGSV